MPARMAHRDTPKGQAVTLTFMQTKTIYVPLLNEGTDVWRPVTAEPIGRAIYRIVSESPDPDNEEWVYVTGQEVAVEEHVFPGGECGLVAVGAAAHTRLDLTLEEACIVQNALNEICNGIDLQDEFETRIGATLAAARALLERVAAMRR
jgi:hypothetical protein